MSHKTNAWTINLIVKTAPRSLGRTRLVLVVLAPILMTLPSLGSAAFTQQPVQDRLERFRKMSVDAETKGLAEPFKGITTNGQITPALFAIRPASRPNPSKKRPALSFPP